MWEWRSSGKNNLQEDKLSFLKQGASNQGSQTWPISLDILVIFYFVNLGSALSLVLENFPFVNFSVPQFLHLWTGNTSYPHRHIVIEINAGKSLEILIIAFKAVTPSSHISSIKNGWPKQAHKCLINARGPGKSIGQWRRDEWRTIERYSFNYRDTWLFSDGGIRLRMWVLPSNFSSTWSRWLIIYWTSS